MEQRLYLKSILKPNLFLRVPKATESWAWTKKRELQGSHSLLLWGEGILDGQGQALLITFMPRQSRQPSREVGVGGQKGCWVGGGRALLTNFMPRQCFSRLL